MSGKVSLLGWDTVFATSYQQANSAIAAAGSTPASFHYADQDGNTIDGAWDVWRIKGGGGGQNLEMICPVTSGDGSNREGSVDLTGGTIVIQVKLDKIPDPSLATARAAGKGGTPYKLMIKTVGTGEESPVVITSTQFPAVTDLEDPDEIWRVILLPALFAEWFKENIAEFNHVFAMLVLNAQADKGDYQWLRPTALSYACADAENLSLEESVLAVLCQTEGDPLGGLAHQVDQRILTGLPPEANSAFAISPGKVLQHLLMPGAVACVHGSTPEYFRIVNDDQFIENSRSMSLGKFKLPDGPSIKPQIDEGNFQISIQNEYVVLELTDAHFNWPSWHFPGNITTSMDIKQRIELELKQVQNGWVFVPKRGMPKTSFTARITLSEGVRIFELGCAIGGALIGFVIGYAFSAVFESSCVAVESTSEAIITVTEETITEMTEQAAPEVLQEVEEEAAEAAAQAAENATTADFTQNFSSTISSWKCRIFGGLIGAFSGALIGRVPVFIREYSRNKYDDLPKFDDFWAECISATTWPTTDRWLLKSAELRGPLVIGGSLQP